MRLHFEEGERQVLAARLGLADDADDQTIVQAMSTWLQEEPEEENNEEETDVEEIDITGQDVIVVDTAEFNRLRRRDRVAAQVEAAAAVRDRNEFIEEAIADGKFSPARRNHYRARYDSDPEGTRALIARLQPNTVPLEARGVDVPEEEVDTSSYPSEWLPEIAGRQGTQGAPVGRPEAGPHRGTHSQGRVFGEDI